MFQAHQLIARICGVLLKSWDIQCIDAVYDDVSDPSTESMDMWCASEILGYSVY